jgi:hypothetical protein
LLRKEEQEQIDELSANTMKSYVKGAKSDVAAHKDQKSSAMDQGDHKTASDSAAAIAKRQAGMKTAKAKLNAEEVEDLLEYESKDGVYRHQGRGAYGTGKPEPHAVDTLRGPKDSELKKIDAEKKKKPKKFSEMVETYQAGGIKGLFEQLAVVEEEASQEEFNKEIKDAQDKSEGKKKVEVAKAAVQAVQNEETHTTVEVVDFNSVNGVEHSEIDLAEKTLTEPETKKKEEVVKSMKKGLQGFKDRYGDKAKSVMYATATKIAKDKA